ncbi:MAG: YdcF family protein [Sphingobacteriales bacterium]
MYGIFSFIFVSLISPFNWLVVLLLIAVFSKRPKWKRRALIGSVIIVFVFGNQCLLYLFARKWDVPPAPLNQKVYSAAIILGGFTSESANGDGYFNAHSDRLIEGLRLKTTGRVTHIMMSGGNNAIDADQFTESGYVKKVLRDFNFPDSVILSEGKSKNTRENAADTKGVLEHAHLQPPYLLVTSAFHMRRAEYIFKKKGIQVVPYPCDYVASKAKPGVLDYFMPNIYTLYTWNYYIKEVFGLALAHVTS